MPHCKTFIMHLTRELSHATCITSNYKLGNESVSFGLVLSQRRSLEPSPLKGFPCRPRPTDWSICHLHPLMFL